MDKLLTVKEASEVSAEFIATAASWPLWSTSEDDVEGKGRFYGPPDVEPTYDTERCLITAGLAVLTPDGGGAPITIKAGQEVWFHLGWSGWWDMGSGTLEKRYAYFDKEGNVVDIEESSDEE